MPVKRASGRRESRRVFGHPRKPSKSVLRVGLYARVSTNDQQTLPMQLHALGDYAARRGWSITMQVKEVGSGASQRQMREKLMDAARRREIDVMLVCVWTAGADRSPICWRLYKNWSISASASCR